MKHLVGKAIGIFALTLSLSNNEANAISRVSLSCPDQFVGTVVQVSTSESPFTSQSLEKVKVKFREQDSSNKKTLTVLKFGPHQFDVGGKYKVKLRNGFICSVEKI